MKTTTLSCLILCLIASSGLQPAMAFDSGSTGADGALNVTNETTLSLPPTGVFNFTTINVASSGTLRFSRNELNTPVYLLATSNVTISGVINVDGYPGTFSMAGQGGPGGFDGGNPPFGGDAPGDGYGPGAGKAHTNNASSTFLLHAGTYATTTSTSSTNKYGNLFVQPLVGGSGGGGNAYFGQGGGGGGGAILIAANSQITLSGTIRAIGGSTQTGAGGGGSGGAIRLVAPVISGSGILYVPGSAGAGDGRIRLDTLDRSQMNFNIAGKSSVGTLLNVFPSPIPRLDITEVAGFPIPVGTNGTVRLTLPLNAPTNQTVKVRATDFNSPITFEVVVTPETGFSERFFSSLDLTATNQLTATVNVIIPAGVPCRVNAWTR